MNWKRGLLRLWVIISLLWLVVATGASLMGYSQQRQLTAAEIAERREQCEETRPTDARCKLVSMETVTVWQLPPWPLLAGVASVPILLFVLGAAGYWAAKGFKTSN